MKTLAYTYVHARNPYVLLIVGLISTGYGIHRILRGIRGDTLFPGTLYTYLPKWTFIVAGLLLQLPRPAAIWFLKEIHRLHTAI